MKDAPDVAFLTRDVSAGRSEPADAAAAARLDGLLQSYGGLLRAAIQRLCPRGLGLDVADIEQEARIRVWKALQSEKEIRNVASYLYRVAATTTIDAVRKAKARREDPIEAWSEPDVGHAGAAGPSPEQLASARVLADSLERAAQRLEPKRCRVVKLHLQGFTTEEVALMLGWSEAKARNLIYRGLADLRHELQALGIDCESF